MSSGLGISLFYKALWRLLGYGDGAIRELGSLLLWVCTGFKLSRQDGAAR